MIATVFAMYRWVALSTDYYWVVASTGSIAATASAVLTEEYALGFLAIGCVLTAITYGWCSGAIQQEVENRAPSREPST